MKRLLIFLLLLVFSSSLYSCQDIKQTVYNNDTTLKEKVNIFLSNTGATPLIEEINNDTLTLLYKVNDSIGFYTINLGRNTPIETTTELTHDSTSEAITIGKVSNYNNTYLCAIVNNKDMLPSAHSIKINISTNDGMKSYEKLLNSNKATFISIPNQSSSDIKIKEVIIYNSNQKELYIKKVMS
ncbi:MAG: hypothetical protein RR515_01825 [Clostridium sp.]